MCQSEEIGKIKNRSDICCCCCCCGGDFLSRFKEGKNKFRFEKKKKIEFIVSLNDLIVGGRISEFFHFLNWTKRTESSCCCSLGT